MCSTYEGNQQVREAKANRLVKQYELFRMKEDEDIETMYSRFQNLQSGLQVIKKSYNIYDHVKKILRSLPARFRPKVTTIQEAKDLDTLSLENLISYLKSHEIELFGDKPAKKFKYLAVIAEDKFVEALKTTESIKELSYGDSDSDSDVEKMAYLTKRFLYLTKRKMLSSIIRGLKGSELKG